VFCPSGRPPLPNAGATMLAIALDDAGRARTSRRRMKKGDPA
jgi:hypothetical protein